MILPPAVTSESTKQPVLSLELQDKSEPSPVLYAAKYALETFRASYWLFESNWNQNDEPRGVSPIAE